MAARARAAKKNMNYAKLNSRGKDNTEEQEALEDGQIVDSPLDLHPRGDDFIVEARSSDRSSLPGSRFEMDETPDTELDYIDDEVVSSQTISVPDSGEQEDEADLGHDETWRKQQELLQANRDKMDRMRRRLERQRKVEEAKLREEQERAELAKMEREILELKQKRSVNLKNLIPASAICKNQSEAIPSLSLRNPDDVLGIPPEKSKQTRMQITKSKPIMPSQEHQRVLKWLQNSATTSDASMERLDNIMIDPCRKQVRDMRKTVGEQQPPREAERSDEVQASEGARKKTGRGVTTQMVTMPRARTRADTDSDGESIVSSVSVLSGLSQVSVARSGQSTASKGSRPATAKSSRVRNPKSGFLDKPRTRVMVKHVWPHMNQNPRYVPEALSFNQLTFPQFVGGECRTILRTNDCDEVYGRLRILSKISYLFEQCRSWDRARSAYFAILSSVEEGEASWASSFGHYDLMCPAPATTTETKSETQKSENRANMRPKVVRKDFFCKEFQRGDCNMQSTHRAWIRNNYEIVEHYCQTCFKAKLGKLGHVPGSEGCSQTK